MQKGSIIAAVGGLLVGGTAVLTFIVQGPGIVVADQQRQIKYEQEQRRALALERDALRAQTAEAAQLRAEVNELRTIAGRLSLAALRGLRTDALADAWDYAQDGIVIGEAHGGGKWLWINRAFADALGYGRNEVLDMGWQKLLHPDDQKRARQVEGRAWIGRVSGPVFRFRRSAAAGGGWVQMRWYCTLYDAHGNAFCIVIVEDVVNDERS